MADLKQRLDDLDTYLIQSGLADATQPIGGDPRVKAVIDGYLDRTNALLLLYNTLSSYVSGYVTTEPTIPSPNGCNRNWKCWASACVNKACAFRRGWADRLGPCRQCWKRKVRRAHTLFYLREMAEQSRYLMSEAEESLAAKAGFSPARRRRVGQLAGHRLFAVDGELRAQRPDREIAHRGAASRGPARS